MESLSRLARVHAGVTTRFARPASRFRLAVGLGFVIAAVGFTTVVVSDRDGIAGTIFGLPDLFGLASQTPQTEEAAPSRGWRWPWHGQHVARRDGTSGRVARAESARYLRSVERTKGAEAPIRLGRKSMCVRLCDGFAFPVGLYHGEQDRASHEATCRSECPGAATALYVEPSGSDSIDEAVRVGTGRNYSELPYAFHYTMVLSDACTCHPPEGNRISSLLRDFTLRRGDAVMTTSGVKVFHGGARFPYRRDDFVTLARSRDVRRADRAAFHAIERASLRPTSNVIAEIVPGATHASASRPGTRDATKGLEHEASLAPVQPQAASTDPHPAPMDPNLAR